MPVYCGQCDSGFRSTRSEATCWPHVRTLSRARRTSIQSVRLSCVGASTELSGTTERLGAHAAPCNCVRESHECAGAFVDDEADATLYVCREPPPSDAVPPPPPPPPLFPPPDSAVCPDSITDMTVVCEVPRQPRALPPLVPQRRGQVNEAWHVVAARGTRVPRLAYVTMVYGPDVAWITERLHFTLASLRRVGAGGADIIVFVPDAAWADALSRALSVVPRVSVRVIDFVQPPLACRETVAAGSATTYLSYEYLAPMYMQLAGSRGGTRALGPLLSLRISRARARISMRACCLCGHHGRSTAGWTTLGRYRCRNCGVGQQSRTP